MKSLKIIKASAGSGKTHTLANEYISLLEDGIKRGDMQAFKHILAVTFTNKATAEMKSRVLEMLSQRGSTEILKTILHDYSEFSVSTIDGFLQKAMRSFAREIGQYASYKIELDDSELIARSTDMLLDSIGEKGNEHLKEWLLDFSIDRIEHGKGWNVDALIATTAKSFMSESFRLQKRGIPDLFGSKADMIDYRDILRGIITGFEGKLSEIGNLGCSIIKKSGIGIFEFSRGSRTPFLHFEIWKKGIVKKPTAQFQNLADDTTQWFTKDSYDEMIGRLGNLKDELNEAINKALDLFGDEYRDYMTAVMILDNFYLTGVFSDLYRILQENLRENNTILLKDTADVIGRIIDGNDTPFFYEKIGSFYTHLMLDEFQDTSNMQWEDFFPLVKNNVANGNSNLIVGDVKQSIYRWRGSDWSLLNERMEKQFREDEIERKEIKLNWRSAPEIVEFNNSLFLGIGNPLNIDKVNSIYGSVKQDCSEKSKEKQGHVLVRFLKDEKEYKWTEKSLEILPDEVNARLESGYRQRDIMILVRENKQGADVANLLRTKGYDIVTSESLSIGSSVAVRKIIATLKMILDPEDRTNNLVLEILGCRSKAETFARNYIRGNSLYGDCEAVIREVVGDVEAKEIAFIHAFLDSVTDYTDRFGSNVREFVAWWDVKGSKASVSAPEGQDAIRVMTIHKAKGLSSPVVIIPFMDEKFEIDSGTMWCKCTKEPFNRMPLVLLNKNKNMTDTWFAEEYKEEEICNYVDSINTAYVAMTRAENEMIVFAKKPKTDKKEKDIDKTESFASLLYFKLQNDNKDYEEYESGTRTTAREDSKEERPSQICQREFTSENISDRIRLKLHGSDFFESETAPRTRGIELHDILSECVLADDLEDAVKRADAKGKLSAGSVGSVTDLLSEAIGQQKGRHWFDGTYKCLNETSLIDSEGNVHRPDRVLLDEVKGEIIVIDYKFGKDRDEYHDQVTLYCRLFSEMGYKTVSGYLWFPFSGIVNRIV